MQPNMQYAVTSWSSPWHGMPQNNVQQGNQDLFDRYIMNEIPIRLIRLSDMTFVGRSDVKKHFQGSVTCDVNYHPSDAVKYAVLSHRWMNDEELTYEDVKPGRASIPGKPTFEDMKWGRASSPGWEKLKNFCDRARWYNVPFAWADTCCIDKSSSTELDESIRSMFRWYKNSHICIIHLGGSETIGKIMTDEWTHRGWTLQELLASRQIKFFNRRWAPMTGEINDKAPGLQNTGLMQALHNATGIPFDNLCDFKPGPSCVDQRMAWAAGRRTTRVEDVAYSLMGIFDVSLHIAYGEGGSRSFYRLIEAIMQGGDPSVLNWSSISAEHPSSFAIPISPQNYANTTVHLPSGLRKLEMAMTSLGLRIPLLVFSLNVTPKLWKFDGSLGRDIALECQSPHGPTMKIKFRYTSKQVYDGEHQFAIGIVTYSVGSCDLPRVRGHSAGFILRRDREDFDIDKSTCITWSNMFSLPVRDFDGWKKVNGTGLAEVDFLGVQGDNYLYVDLKYLQTAYL